MTRIPRLLFTALLLILTIGQGLVAQNRELTEEQKMQNPAYRAMMTARDSSLYIPETLNVIDTLAYNWAERQFIHIDPNCTTDPNPEPTPDSLYIQRLRALPTIIDMPFNQPVKKSLDFYLTRRRSLIEHMVGLGFNHYFPIFENALQRHDLPSELKYLACIESALRVNAYSHAHAAGLWQFIPSSGILQGLEVNSYIDERYDVYKSTDAACKFLKQLFNKFQDWSLAIAAYNCGPGNIDKAIARSGGRRTFWELYNYLPKETRSYVPLFIAATYSMTYHWEHGICGSEGSVPIECDTIMVDQFVHFEQISHCLNMPIEQIESLNPQYICDIVPASIEKSYSITLPADKAMAFLQFQDSIYAFKADSLLPHNGEIKEVLTKGRRNSYVNAGGNRKAGANSGRGGTSVASGSSHIVRKGETLSSIAKRYHTTVAALKRSNGLRHDRLRAGQKLRLP